MVWAFDGDGHVEESEETYSDKYWDAPELRDRRPVVVENPETGFLTWLIDDRAFPLRYGPGTRFGATPASKNGVPSALQRMKFKDSLESTELRSAEPRLKTMDEEHIAVSVNYPTMLFSWPHTYDPALGAAIVRSYNNWIADKSSQAPDRLKWVTAIDALDPQEAAREIKRTKEMGSVGVMITGMFGDKQVDHASMEPIWAAAAEAGLPVGVHLGFCCPGLDDLFDNVRDNATVSAVFTVMLGFHSVLTGGVLDRYPDLKVVFLEAGCEWVPFMSDRVTTRIEASHSRPALAAQAGDTPNIGESAYTAKLLPEEYVKRGQVYFGFEVEDEMLPYVVNKFGDECWMWASDIPHADRRLEAVDYLMARDDLSEETKRKLLVDNGARFYGLSVPEQTAAAG